MKIVLVTQHNGSELTFEQPIIKIGRDADNCQIVYEQAQFPSVSRHHAEIHWKNSDSYT